MNEIESPGILGKLPLPTKPQPSRPRVARASATILLLVPLCFLVGFRGVRQPVQIRLEGYLDAPVDQVKAIRPVTIQIGKGPQRSLVVTAIVTLGAGPSGTTLLRDIAHYRPAFRLTGDQKLLDRVASAGPDQLIKITGNLTSSRYLMVSLVDVAAHRDKSR
jgi:hypothetical protein